MDEATMVGKKREGGFGDASFLFLSQGFTQVMQSAGSGA